jgi:hypothetical protein
MIAEQVSQSPDAFPLLEGLSVSNRSTCPELVLETSSCPYVASEQLLDSCCVLGIPAAFKDLSGNDG